MSEPGRDNKTFETKVSNLIAATRHLEIPQILLLRRLTLSDPESLKWSNARQLNVVFSVILTKAIERVPPKVLQDLRAANYEPALPKNNPPALRNEDRALLSDMVEQMLGPAPMSEAETTQAGFEKLIARGPAKTMPRISRSQAPIKEPPPLFAAQLGDMAVMPPAKLRAMGAIEQAAAAAAAAAETPENPFTDFSALFDDTICNHTRKVLALLRVSGSTNGVRVPFILAPEFTIAYEDVLRRFVLPAMRSSRHIQTLGTQYNWSEVGGAKLVELIQGSEVNNPILHNWDTRWQAFRPQKVAGKVKKPKPEDYPWQIFAEDATRNNYEPPTEDSIQLLQDLIRFEIDSIAKAWRELTQLYEQEFSPNARQERARDGAFRDGIMKWASKLPDHLGEFFTIKAYFDMPRVDGHFVRRQINNFGRSDSERRRNAPYLVDFSQNLPD